MSAEQNQGLEVVPVDGSGRSKQSLISQILRAVQALSATREARGSGRRRYEQREYFNSDGTKKFVVCVDEGNTPGWQFREVGLWARGFDPRSWNAIISLRRTGTGGQTKFVIQTWAIMDEDLYWSTELFEYDSQGNLADLNIFSRPPRDRDGQRQEEKDRKHMHNSGCYHAQDLPSKIDFNKTVEQFLRQAASLDFRTPLLIPYEEPPILER